MTEASFDEGWLPAATALAIEPIGAADVESRAASAGIRAQIDCRIHNRRMEHLAGRLAALAALRSAGSDDAIVGSRDGVPVWPSGFCGSISHSAGLAVSVAARKGDWRSLGIDIETRISASRARILRKAMRDDEFAAAQALTDPWAWTRAWAAKEAAFKCLSALGADMAFEALVPSWTGSARGELHASVGGAAIRLVLCSRIQDELIWVVAGAC